MPLQEYLNRKHHVSKGHWKRPQDPKYRCVFAPVEDYGRAGCRRGILHSYAIQWKEDITDEQKEKIDQNSEEFYKSTEARCWYCNRVQDDSDQGKTNGNKPDDQKTGGE